MTSGALVKWDGVNQKLVTSASNVGSDTQPVKIVGGEPVQVANALALASSVTPAFGTCTINTAQFTGGDIVYAKIGRIVILSMRGLRALATGSDQVICTDAPRCSSQISSHWHSITDSGDVGNTWIDVSSTMIKQSVIGIHTFWQTIVYLSDE